MKIIGISAFYHDSAAVLLSDGAIVAAAQEERFTRKKHDEGFPANALKFCLKKGNCQLEDIDYIVFYDKPFLKFERLLETYYAFAPKGLRSFLSAMPIWMKEKLFLKRLLKEELNKLGKFDAKKQKILYSEHHLAHAASTFFVSPFEESAILTIDGVGEWATASLAMGKGNDIQILKELHFPHSLGLLYSAFTYFLGFRVNSGEYKLMGLAPYGNPEDPQTKEFVDLIKSKLIDLKADGSVWLDQSYFDYATGLRMANDKKWEQLFGFARRSEKEALQQKHCNLAMAIQQVTEEVVLKMAEYLKELTGQQNICLSGGVALNCVANGKLEEAGIFENIYIQPAAGDAGGALGAAISTHFMYLQNERTAPKNGIDSILYSYLGPEFSNAEIQSTLDGFKADYQLLETHQISKETAKLLADGKVVGWFQGGMEWGPRALGNRSILGDPGRSDMQKKLNLKIKYREGFRPFAPIVIEEDAHQFFEMKGPSPYMLMVKPVQQSIRKPLPSDFYDMELMERLKIERSTLPAITHLDFSARIQTVSKDSNERLYDLLQNFKQEKGYGVLVNTSFNVRGEPIVCTPEDAYHCFMNTEMDALAIGDFLLLKEKQPNWEKKSAEELFGLD
ncbi:MAG: carbamoyltransferase [Chitinophagales bacterium]